MESELYTVKLKPETLARIKNLMREKMAADVRIQDIGLTAMEAQNMDPGEWGIDIDKGIFIRNKSNESGATEKN